jgi:hypothetical protein
VSILLPAVDHFPKLKAATYVSLTQQATQQRVVITNMQGCCLMKIKLQSHTTQCKPGPAFANAKRTAEGYQNMQYDAENT